MLQALWLSYLELCWHNGVSQSPSFVFLSFKKKRIDGHRAISGKICRLFACMSAPASIVISDSNQISITSSVPFSSQLGWLDWTLADPHSESPFAELAISRVPIVFCCTSVLKNTKWTREVTGFGSVGMVILQSLPNLRLTILTQGRMRTCDECGL